MTMVERRWVAQATGGWVMSTTIHGDDGVSVTSFASGDPNDEIAALRKQLRRAEAKAERYEAAWHAAAGGCREEEERAERAEALLTKACAFEEERGDVVWRQQGFNKWRLRDRDGFDLIVGQRLFWDTYEEAKAALDDYRAAQEAALAAYEQSRENR